MPTESDFLDQ